MAKDKTIMWAVGIGAATCGILALVGTGAGMANMVRLLGITPKLSGKPKFNWTKITVPVAIDIANRSDTEITLGITNAALLYNGKTIAQTQPALATVGIKAYSTSTLSGLKLDVGLASLLSLVSGAVSTFQAKLMGGDWSEFLNALTINVSCVLNGTIAFDFTKKLGEEQSVEVDQKDKATVSGLGANGTFYAGDRQIRGIADYIGLIPDQSELRRQDLIVNVDASVFDTARLMHAVAKQYKGDTARLAKHLSRPTLRETLQAIWDFVAQHIKYVHDSAFQEQVRRPLRTLYDQKGDCDCYATLIGSMLENLGIDYRFRLAAYSGDYQHVYVVVPDGSGRMLPVDPVNEFCFAEKRPTKYKDI